MNVIVVVREKVFVFGVHIHKQASRFYEKIISVGVHLADDGQVAAYFEIR